MIATQHGACDVLKRHFASEGGSLALVSTGIISESAAKKQGTVSLCKESAE